jgi:hypothetical protein
MIPPPVVPHLDLAVQPCPPPSSVTRSVVTVTVSSHVPWTRIVSPGCAIFKACVIVCPRTSQFTRWTLPRTGLAIATITTSIPSVPLAVIPSSLLCHSGGASTDAILLRAERRMIPAVMHRPAGAERKCWSIATCEISYTTLQVCQVVVITAGDLSPPPGSPKRCRPEKQGTSYCLGLVPRVSAPEVPVGSWMQQQGTIPRVPPINLTRR